MGKYAKEAERRRRGTDSSEYISRVEFHAMFFQQRDEFLLEAHLPVMRLLRPDVSNYGVQIGRAYAERAEAALPGETTPHPARRARLDLKNGIG